MKKLSERIENLKVTIKTLKENDLDTTAAYQKLHILEDKYSFFNQPGMYNGPTGLFISYQWHMMNEGGDECVLNNEYETAQEAFEVMGRCMPDCCKLDDGYDLKDWQALIDQGDGDWVFIQHNAQLDEKHNLLARLWPVIKQEG